MLCDAVEVLKASPGPGNVFANVPCDPEEPFKTAIAALQILDSNPPAEVVKEEA